MNSKKYISVEDAIKTTWMILKGLGYAIGENPQLKETVPAIFDTAPTIDAVPVVRCKDCKWKRGYECVRFADVRPYPDDFCSRAERKDNVEHEGER